MKLEEAAGRGAAQAPLPTGPVAWLAWLGGAVSAALIIVILVVTTVAVVFRYVLGNPLQGTDEAAGYLVVAAVMLGAAEALRRDDHINIDILISGLAPRTRIWFDGFGYLAVLGFAVMLLFTGWHTVTFSYGFDSYSTGALEMPLWIPQSTMLAGAVLLGLVAAARLFGLLRRKPAA